MRWRPCFWLPVILLAAAPLGAQDMPSITPDQLKARAACVGLTVEEYREWSNPTNGENRQPTKAERARQAELGKKVRAIPRQQQDECNLRESNAEVGTMISGMQQQVDAMEQRNAAASGMTEAPGTTAHLSDDVAADLAAGRTVVRDIDWVAGKGDVSATGAASFHAAMEALAPALAAAGGSFTVDFFLDKRYSDDQAAHYVADMRMKTLRAALPGVKLDKGKVSRDADTRLEIVKAR